jgi:hypothetical protein
MGRPQYTVEIESYGIRLWQYKRMDYPGITVPILGELDVRGGRRRKELQFIIAFVPDGSEIPQPVFDEEEHMFVMFHPFRHMQYFVNLVRNEKPIFAYIDTENLSNCCISTAGEEVGEEEDD